MNSREVIDDIRGEFDYLESYGFKPSGETITPGRVSIGFQGKDYNISLSFEYIAENFDFVLIDIQNPANYRQFWRLIHKYSLEPFDYYAMKPTYEDYTDYTYESYKDQLHVLASKFKAVLPIVLIKDKTELFNDQHSSH
jgi:hypothetical protein